MPCILASNPPTSQVKGRGKAGQLGVKSLVTSTHRVTYTCLVSCFLSYAELLREELKRDGLSFIPNEGGRAAVPASPWPATLLCAGKIRVKGQGSPQHPLGSVPALPEVHLSSLAPRARVPPPFSGPHPLLKHLPKTCPQPHHKYLLGPEMQSLPVPLQTIEQLSHFPPNTQQPCESSLFPEVCGVILGFPLPQQHSEALSRVLVTL